MYPTKEATKYNTKWICEGELLKKIAIFFGILNLLIGLLCINIDFNMFLFFFIIFSGCFIYCRKTIFKFFARPIIKRINLLNKKKENLIKQINLLEKEKGIANINEINKSKEIVDKLMIREKELKKQIIILEAKKENLEIVTNQERIINRAIREEEKTLDILSNKSMELENKKNALENEIKRLEKIIVPMKEKRNFINKCNINDIDNMDGFEFEKFISKLLSNLGYTYSAVTKQAGDYGIDVIAIKDKIKYAIQCKNYSQPVGNKAIQEAYSGKTFYDCHVAIVITNNYFTANAINQAKMNKVVLWDRDKLKELIKTLT